MIYEVQATLSAPLTLSMRRAAGNDVGTFESIPGTALRGALAAAYLETGQVDNAFRSLFLSGQVAYGSLRLDGADVWPLSSRLCKLNEDEHTVQDRLLETAAGAPSPRTCTDEGCNATLTIPRGFVRLQKPRGEEMSRFIAKKPKQSRVAHSAINPELLTSATAQLFSTRSLNEGQVFRGRIVAAETATPHLNSLFAQRSRFRFGRAKTRGMGAVDLRIAPLGSEFTEDPSRIAARLENMQTTAAQIAGRLAGKTVVTVTLQTPALVWDDFLLAPEWLSPVDVLLNETDGWKLAAWFSETAAISGWHAAAGVPKTEVFALQAGSCFAFAKTGPANTGLLAQWAARIQRGGIGERTQEGFGEVVVCHQIHFAPAGGNA